MGLFHEDCGNNGSGRNPMKRVLQFLSPISLRRLPYLWLAVGMILSSLAVYLPYIHNLRAMLFHTDGVLYAAIAKHGYNSPLLTKHLGLPGYYFISHNLMYPFSIRLVALFTGGDYQIAMILASLMASVIAGQLFYLLLKTYRLVVSPFWTALLFCMLPASWLLCHARGSSEPLFLCFVFGAFLAHAQKRTVALTLLIILAFLTRVVGLLLVPVFAWIYLLEKQWRRAFLIGLGGLTGIGILLTFCHFFYGDFFALFKWNLGKLKIIQLPPFSVFQHSSTIHLESLAKELYVLSFTLYLLGTFAIYQKKEFFIYCLVFLFFSMFVYHPGFPRYFLPVAPFALLVGFDPVLTCRPCRFIMPVILFLNYLYVSNALRFYVVPPPGQLF